ncbi:heme-binding beta-barrel domain-containing protein [Shewanella sp. UCD-KL21]|uniref:heme-binding beta-barrel domain-containing protein n=1 Tax=Shewanella sp. UCD-KL21 TaxID=1917164 RepID=UPI00097054BE|nr:heme-binding beta-barrel domain-containing protein [Shewanella sp. UCD-KL21]
MNSIIDGIDYGPLAQLIGKWSGSKGLDKAPDNQANIDESKFTDELTFSVAGSSQNAEEQDLVSVKYHHVIRRTENGLIFHDQIGHWIYEPSTETIMHSLTIPRAVCVLAGGKFQHINGESIFNVEAQAGSETFGILQSPFMIEKAKTESFKMQLSVKHNELKYREVMQLHIYGKDFEHIDESTLHRVTYDFD